MIETENGAQLELDDRRHGGAAELRPNATRSLIYEHIRSRPGDYFRGMQRHLSLSNGTLRHHLQQLQRAGLVVTRQGLRVKAFFAGTGVDRRDITQMYWSQQPQRRRLLELVMENPGISFGALAERMAMARSTVSYHLSQLVRGEVLVRHRAGRDALYEAADAERARHVLTQATPLAAPIAAGEA